MSEQTKGLIGGITIITLAAGGYLIFGPVNDVPPGCEAVIATCEVLLDSPAANSLRAMGAGTKPGYQSVRANALLCDEGGRDAVVSVAVTTDGGVIQVVDGVACQVEHCLGKCAQTLEVVADSCAYKQGATDECWRADPSEDGGIIYRDPGVENIYPKSRLDGGACVPSPCTKIFGKEKG